MLVTCAERVVERREDGDQHAVLRAQQQMRRAATSLAIWTGAHAAPPAGTRQ